MEEVAELEGCVGAGIADAHSSLEGEEGVGDGFFQLSAEEFGDEAASGFPNGYGADTSHLLGDPQQGSRGEDGVVVGREAEGKAG